MNLGSYLKFGDLPNVWLFQTGMINNKPARNQNSENFKKKNERVQPHSKVEGCSPQNACIAAKTEGVKD